MSGLRKSDVPEPMRWDLSGPDTGSRASVWTLRELAAALFRRKRLFLVSFRNNSGRHTWRDAIASQSLPVPNEDPGKKHAR
jgi:hypothetical protein